MVWRGVGHRSAVMAPAAYTQSTAESPAARILVRSNTIPLPVYCTGSMPNFSIVEQYHPTSY
jgi:hypothetical protein